MTDWDRITTSAPINKDAALARDGGGVSWEPERSPVSANQFRTDVQPPTRRPLKGSPDFTGQRFGRFVVLGLSVELKQSAGGQARWVVRCDCGAYEHRTYKGLRNSKEQGKAMCTHCEYVERLKAGKLPTPEVLAERKARKEARKAAQGLGKAEG